jgi:hypothetical protein
MNKLVGMSVSFVIGGAMALIGAWVLKPSVKVVEPTAIPATVQLPTATPRPSITPRPTASTAPTTAPISARQTSAGGIPLGWDGQIQCYDCTPFSVHIRVSHYNPMVYDQNIRRLNCWDYSEKFEYCLSPTWIGVPWDGLWGLAAACPADWAIGSWVEIPGIGAFICFDHGERINCDSDFKLCRVDLLGPGGESWDGQEFNATLWVPKSYLLRNQGDN